VPQADGVAVHAEKSRREVADVCGRPTPLHAQKHSSDSPPDGLIVPERTTARVDSVCHFTNPRCRYNGAMDSKVEREPPSYSTDLLRVFADVLQEYGGELGEWVQAGIKHAEDRVPVDVAHQALLFAVAHTEDADLGLKAARRIILGDVGAIDYVVSSATTVRSAIEQTSRYARLINDVLDVKLEEEGSIALVRLENRVALPRAAADFQVGAFFRNHVSAWLGSRLGELTVWFTHDCPADLGEYERTFDPAQVRFSASVLAFAFDRRILEQPLPKADPNLQAMLVPYADQMLSALPPAHDVTANVRSLVGLQLAEGGPDVGKVAARLGMSLRTLARRLEDEGTTFRELVDDVRQQLALELVSRRAATFSEISDQLGFSQVAAFHRAFRRWTGQTPLDYRRGARSR
jgi:AraC-like DNA-binding protein